MYIASPYAGLWEDVRRGAQSATRLAGCLPRAGSIDFERAARLNDRYARAVSPRWESERASIERLLGFETTPNAREFAVRVAMWQCKEKLEPVDGIIGPKTHRVMRTRLRDKGVPPDEPAPAPGSPGLVARPRPRGGHTTSERCKGGATLRCPRIEDLLRVESVRGVAFEYVAGRGALVLDPHTRLWRVNPPRVARRPQYFIPRFAAALTTFLGNMERVGMPVETILTMGSYNCRCVRNRAFLSNHSYGDALDIAGVRWRMPDAPASPMRETIVKNFDRPDIRERVLIRRMNACLRLSFPAVIDYSYNAAHRNHFHCDLRAGQGFPASRWPFGLTTMVFVREALEMVLGRPVSLNTALLSRKPPQIDPDIQRAFMEFSREASPDMFGPGHAPALNRIMNLLFERVASGRGLRAPLLH